jgi:hypothetical protein
MFVKTLPVISRGTVADELKACLKLSALWKHVTFQHRAQSEYASSLARRFYC